RPGNPQSAFHSQSENPLRTARISRYGVGAGATSSDRLTEVARPSYPRLHNRALGDDHPLNVTAASGVDDAWSQNQARPRHSPPERDPRSSWLSSTASCHAVASDLPNLTYKLEAIGHGSHSQPILSANIRHWLAISAMNSGVGVALLSQSKLSS